MYEFSELTNLEMADLMDVLLRYYHGEVVSVEDERRVDDLLEKIYYD